MVQLTLTLVVTLCCSLAMSELLIKDNVWQAWKEFHEKKYESDDEESLRYTIWNENRKSIERHNSDEHSTFQLEMNHLGDMVPNNYFKIFLFKIVKPIFHDHLFCWITGYYQPCTYILLNSPMRLIWARLRPYLTLKWPHATLQADALEDQRVTWLTTPQYSMAAAFTQFKAIPHEWKYHCQWDQILLFLPKWDRKHLLFSYRSRPPLTPLGQPHSCKWYQILPFWMCNHKSDQHIDR